MADSVAAPTKPVWIPMKWPVRWRDPAALGLLADTGINYLLFEKNPALDAVLAQAKAKGIQTGDTASLPAGVSILPGEWPGVKMSASGAKDTVSAGPTGAPWVDSNGWKVRLRAALQPGSTVWVDTSPKPSEIVTRESYVLSMADAAAYGGSWIISLDDSLVADIADKKTAALETWKALGRAVSLIASRAGWSQYTPEAVVGVLSDFSGQNEFLSNELLNLLARANEQYRIIPNNGVSASSFASLKVVIYADAEPPVPELRKQVLAFVEAGGMLISVPAWGDIPGKAAKWDDHPRYSTRLLGKGRLQIAKSAPDDPFLFANDAVVLVGHREDLVRFWNVGAMESFLTVSPDRRKKLLHMLFYARELNGEVSRGGPAAASVRVAGRYRTGTMWTLYRPDPVTVHMEYERGAVELHLPPISEYAAVELAM